MHHPDHQALFCHQSPLLKTLDLVGLKLNKAKSELDPVQDIQFLGLRLRLDQSFTPSVQGPGDNSTCMPNILPNFSVVHSSVPVHGVPQLGFRSAPEAIITTFSFFRSDKPVYSTALLRPITPCQPTQAMEAPDFLTSGIPIRPFQVELKIFTDASTQGWGAHMGDPRFRVLGAVQSASFTSTVWSSRR